MSNIDKLKPGKYAILFRNNWDGEGDTYEAFATLDAEGIWRNEDGDELLEYQGDEVMRAWPLDDGSNVLALLDELEAKDKRLAEQAGVIAKQEKWIKDVEATMIAATDRAVAAEERVAELEARDKPKFVQCWSCKHDIEVLAIADCDGYCPRCAAPIDLDDEPYAGAGKGEAS